MAFLTKNTRKNDTQCVANLLVGNRQKLKVWAEVPSTGQRVALVTTHIGQKDTGLAGRHRR